MRYWNPRTHGDGNCPIHREAQLIGKSRVYAAFRMVTATPRTRKLRPCEKRIDQTLPLAHQWLYRSWRNNG